MSRPVIVYLVMIVSLVGGLWAVLAIGATLHPPEDLAGKWELQTMGEKAAGTQAMIEQSGRFFQVAFKNGLQLDLKFAEEGPAHLLLANGPWKMSVDGPTGGDEKTIDLTGPQSGHWMAHRTLRTFPADVSAKEGH